MLGSDENLATFLDISTEVDSAAERGLMGLAFDPNYSTNYEPTTVQFPDSYGDYFFADLCNGWIRSYDPANDTASGFATGLSSVVDLEVSNDGELYFLSRGTPGTVNKITHSGN